MNKNQAAAYAVMSIYTLQNSANRWMETKRYKIRTDRTRDENYV